MATSRSSLGLESVGMRLLLDIKQNLAKTDPVNFEQPPLLDPGVLRPWGLSISNHPIISENVTLNMRYSSNFYHWFIPSNLGQPEKLKPKFQK